MLNGFYTYHIPQHRRLKERGVPLLDTTVKTGHVQVAPRWDMVLGHKRGIISDEQYTEQYHALLDYWWFQHSDFFDWVLSHPVIALGCYCRPGAFCHRHLLAAFLSTVSDRPVLGELT